VTSDRIASARRADLPSMLPNLRRVGEDKYRGPCAFHGGDNPSGMVVDRRRDGSWGWHCFTGDCGHGSVIDAWLLLNDGRSFADAVDALSTDFGTSGHGAGQGTSSTSTTRARAASETPCQVRREPGLTLICDACRNETAEVSPRQYGNGKSRPYHTTTALQEAGALGWEIAGSVNACVGPKCLERIAG
jgi:hypothetical protein